MAISGDDLKAKLTAYITTKQAEIDRVKADAQIEVTRLQTQITAAKKAAQAWTPEVNTLIAFLQDAGITLTE